MPPRRGVSGMIRPHGRLKLCLIAGLRKLCCLPERAGSGRLPQLPIYSLGPGSINIPDIAKRKKMRIVA